MDGLEIALPTLNRDLQVPPKKRMLDMFDIMCTTNSLRFKCCFKKTFPQIVLLFSQSAYFFVTSVLTKIINGHTHRDITIAQPTQHTHTHMNFHTAG